MTGDCEGGECWFNPETGYMEYCPKHEAQIADEVMAWEEHKSKAAT